MKKLEELLNLDLGCKFDTPKKLNRSNKEIPQEIVDNLENGDFTAEMIKDLAAGNGQLFSASQQPGRSFPIFRYRTCITVHGNWPEVSRTRIGGYKNVHQNQNGSVEIYYSAIDREKIKRVCNVLRSQEGRKWNYSESSTGRAFYIQRPITKDTIQKVADELKPIATRLTALQIYGYVNLYTAATPWGQTYLVLRLTPLAIPEDQVSKLIQELTGLDEAGQARVIMEAEERERKRKEEVEASLKQYREEAAAEKAEGEKKRAALLPQIAHLEECNDLKRGILVKVSAGVTSYGTRQDPEFIYYRYDGAGSFGRLKVSKATSKSYSLEGLTWKEGKQKTAEDLKRFQGFRLAKPNAYTTPRVPQRTPAAPTTGGKILRTINY